MDLELVVVADPDAEHRRVDVHVAGVAMAAVDVHDAQDRIADAERVGLRVAEQAVGVDGVEPERAQVLQRRVARGGSG